MYKEARFYLMLNVSEMACQIKAISESYIIGLFNAIFLIPSAPPLNSRRGKAEKLKMFLIMIFHKKKLLKQI